MTTDIITLPTVPDGHRLAIRALNESRYGSHGRWPQRYRWTEPAPNLVLCERGWHASRDTFDIIHGGWFGERLWIAELAGQIVEDENKVAAERARLLIPLPWDKQTARLYACDVAERVLPIYEARYPHDDRPRKAIEVSRRYARGEATVEELRAAYAAAATAARYATARYAAAYAAATAARYVAAATAAATAATAATAAARCAAALADEQRWQAGHLASVLGLSGSVLDGGSS